MGAGARAAAPTTPYGQKAGSVRSKQSIGWAKKAATAPSSTAGYDDAIPASKTRRIFVYVIGGITHRWVWGCLSPMILALSSLYR